ncbi:phosphotransferase [Paenibacillus sp. LMG 31458]|uniref:Phosphotransferase n=2 Tax=Paenibacillus phytorum TaxID=2654977 RepID=A0ABX1XR15_9BACL|nr:phosphotransferase [Paenibacillus phytorum]
MALRLDVKQIIKDLSKTGVIESTAIATNKMNGTTEGLVYTLTVNDEPKYVLKLDSPQNISLVEQLQLTYRESTLLPKLLYTEPNKAFIVYSYITGTTHYNRGSKIDWLTAIVKELLNHYVIYQKTDKWGFWLEDPCQTWREFIDQGVEYARINVGSLLPIEDYNKVKSFVENISKGEGQERYLLHGDCGVHNFVFDKKALTGVIDPSPIVGPVLYDFMYAFCSSPDDLNLETLFQAYSLLIHDPIERSRLIEEVIIQLYCRIGICLKHHPHDLSDYLKAWDYWKVRLP